MKNITKHSLAIGWLFLAAGMSPVYAQQPDFVVYHVTPGKVYKINPPRHVLLKDGDKLYQSDWISIPQNAQALLVCQSNKCLRLYKADTLKLSGLVASCVQDKPSVLASFFSTVWNSVTGKDESENDETNNGVISRGNSDLGKLNVSPDTINYLSGPLKITWATSKIVNVRFYKQVNAADPIKEFDAKTNSIRLDSLAAGLQRPGVYYWSVNTVRNQNAPRFYLRLWQQQQYQQAVQLVLKTVIKTSPAQTAFMSGFLLEKAGFPAEAGKYYKKAFTLKPTNKIYKTFNARFL
jgi:hypothetical protein